MAINAPMSHRKAGNAQVGLSYFFLAGFFGALSLEAFGLLKVNVTDRLHEMVMLVLSFWFMRQRETGAEPPPPPSEPEKPTGPKAPPTP